MLLITVMRNSSETAAPAESVAVTRTSIAPTSAFSAMPLKVRVGASKLSQPGRAAPLLSVAVWLSVSPTSTSAKVPAPKVKLKAASSVTVWSASGSATVGMSLLLSTVTRKSSDTAAPAESVAVTRRSIAPTSAFSGVPLKVRVVASKLSQDGRAAPLLSEAV